MYHICLCPLDIIVNVVQLPVILFGILGSYLFLHLCENILLRLGKSVLKYMKMGKSRPFLDWE